MDVNSRAALPTSANMLCVSVSWWCAPKRAQIPGSHKSDTDRGNFVAARRRRRCRRCAAVAHCLLEFARTTRRIGDDGGCGCSCQEYG